MIYMPSAFVRDWPAKDFKIVVGYILMMAKEDDGHISKQFDELDIVTDVAMACDVGFRRTSAILGHMREIGLLTYRRAGPEWNAELQDIFVNRNWVEA